QALAIAWDSRPAAQGGQRWFHLYPDQNLTTHDPLHWTGPNQNWNYMCADCHSTDLRKNFDLSRNAYPTTWSAIDVSGEARYGAGSNHVAWAKATPRPADATKGLAAALTDASGGRWVLDPAVGTAIRSAPRQSTLEIDTCAHCHSRRREIVESFAYGH